MATYAEIILEIEETKIRLAKVRTAIDELVLGGTQTYSLDTGQTRQSVVKLNLTELRNLESSLVSRISTLEARSGGGTSYGRPAS